MFTLIFQRSEFATNLGTLANQKLGNTNQNMIDQLPQWGSHGTINYYRYSTTINQKASVNPKIYPRTRFTNAQFQLSINNMHLPSPYNFKIVRQSLPMNNQMNGGLPLRTYLLQLQVHSPFQRTTGFLSCLILAEEVSRFPNTNVIK